MKRINFKEEIKESEKTLLNLERREKNGRIKTRLMMLRLLKSGNYNLKTVSEILHLSYKTVHSYWEKYKRGGLEELCKWGYQGRKARVDYQTLKKDLGWDKIGPRSLKEAQKILEERYSAKYTIKGVWYLLKVNKIKLNDVRKNFSKDGIGQIRRERRNKNE